MNGKDIVATFRISLKRFHNEGMAFIRSHGIDPFPESMAAIERSTYARPESLHSVAAIAGYLIESVGEHVTAFIKNITEPVEPIACWTCVRSMLESASIAAWLFDPVIDAQERVGRCFAIRHEGMVQQIKLMRAVNSQPSEVKKLEHHIRDVENVAIGLGFQKVRNKKGEIIGIGQRMLSATEIIKVVLDEAIAYRILSAVAHGHNWAIRKLAFTKGETVESSTNGVSTIQFLKNSGNVDGYTYLAVRVAKSLALPLWNQCLYFGWDKERLRAILESVYDELCASAEIRFWSEEEVTP